MEIHEVTRQKHQFGVLFQTIYLKEVVFKLFTEGVHFYLYCAKGGEQFNRELTCDIELLCQKLYTMGCYSCSDATTLNFIFSRSSHSVLFNGRCYIVFMSSKDKMFLLGREPRLLKKKEVI